MIAAIKSFSSWVSRGFTWIIKGTKQHLVWWFAEGTLVILTFVGVANCFVPVVIPMTQITLGSVLGLAAAGVELMTISAIDKGDHEIATPWLVFSIITGVAALFGFGSLLNKLTIGSSELAAGAILAGGIVWFGRIMCIAVINRRNPHNVAAKA